MFKENQKVKVINANIFCGLIDINDIGVITCVDTRHEEYVIYFAKQNMKQYCPFHYANTHLEAINKRHLKRR